MITYDILEGFEFDVPTILPGKMIRCFYDEDGIISALSGIVKGRTVHLCIYSRGVTDPSLKPTAHLRHLEDNAEKYGRVLKIDNITAIHPRSTPLSLMGAYFSRYSFTRDEQGRIIFWLSLTGETL